MKLLKQPNKSRTCGQHCVAMVAGITAAESIELFGHKRGTTFKMVSDVFKKLGFNMCQKKARAFLFEKDLPKICLLSIRWGKGGGHWVVYNNGMIYCPSEGIYKYSLRALGNKNGVSNYYMHIGERELNDTPEQ